MVLSIGLQRLLAAYVEQNNDEHGIIWSMSIAPYKVAIVVINPKDDKQINAGNDLYDKLNSMGIDTLIDDRDERPGVKFNDIDLIGIPIRITIGKKINDGLLEFKLRTESNSCDYNILNIIITRIRLSP